LKLCVFFFSSRRRHTRFSRDWSSDVCSSDLPKTLGRFLNVIGEPIDERGPVDAEQRAPIHAEAPLFVDQSTEAAILVTGIKVIEIGRASCREAVWCAGVAES